MCAVCDTCSVKQGMKLQIEMASWIMNREEVRMSQTSSLNLSICTEVLWVSGSSMFTFS